MPSKATEDNPWQSESRQMLNVTHDSGSFVEPSQEVLDAVDSRGMSAIGSAPVLRLYDGKMFDHFNHRLASVGYREGVTFRTSKPVSTQRDQYLPLWESRLAGERLLPR